MSRGSISCLSDDNRPNFHLHSGLGRSVSPELGENFDVFSSQDLPTPVRELDGTPAVYPCRPSTSSPTPTREGDSHHKGRKVDSVNPAGPTQTPNDYTLDGVATQRNTPSDEDQDPRPGRRGETPTARGLGTGVKALRRATRLTQEDREPRSEGKTQLNRFILSRKSGR